MSVNNHRSKKPSIVIKGKNAQVAAITNDPNTARYLMNHQGEVAPKAQSVLVTNKATGFGCNVDAQTAAYFLGLSVNGHQPGGKPFGWDPKTHELFYAGEERVRICDTRVPVKANMEAFLRVASKIAGVPEQDLIRMFPPKRENTILIYNPAPDAEPESIPA